MRLIDTIERSVVRLNITAGIPCTMDIKRNSNVGSLPELSVQYESLNLSKEREKRRVDHLILHIHTP